MRERQMTDYLEQVRRHAGSLGMTPLELVRAAGVNESTWRRWRAGTFAPQTRTLDRLLSYQPKKAASVFRRGIA